MTWHIGSTWLLAPGPGMTLWEAAVLGLPVTPLFPERPAVTTAQVVEVLPAGPGKRAALAIGAREDDGNG